MQRLRALPVKIALASLFLFAFHAPAGAVDFLPAVNYATGPTPLFVATGDFNGDGKMDLAVANANGDNVSVLLGNGDGSFRAAVNYGVGTAPTSIAVGDFNGDGKLDLAVANLNSSDLSVLLGNGDGTFRAAVNYAAGPQTISIAAGDLNGDGKLDLTTANLNGTVSVLLGNGDGTFQTAVNLAVGTNSHSVAVGDFNRDGKLDLAVADAFDNKVYLLLGNGNGTFGAPVGYPVGMLAHSVAVGDFNGDGKLDLAVGNVNSNNVSVLLGNGDGTFGASVNYATGTGPISVVVADFNSDGKSDLVLANNGSNNVSVLVGNGDGTFQAAVNVNVGQSPGFAAAGDFNGDGKPDLAVANETDGNVSVLLNNFLPPAAPFGQSFLPFVIFTVGRQPASVAVGDFNGDGKPDLAVANGSSNNVSVLLGNGDGTFQAAVNYGAGSGPSSVVVGDFNGDGKLDLAVTNGGSNNVSVLLGNGNGTFQAVVNFAVGTLPTFVAVGDFNADGKLDLAVVNRSSNNVSVLLGNGSGGFTPATGSPFAAGPSPNSVAVGDFNGDGKLDIAVANLLSDNNVRVLLGNGDGTFQAAMNFAAGTHPIAVAVGDFNGDGKLDMAAANGDSNNVSVLLGKGDGTFQAAVNYGAGSGPGSVAVGDFNGDGKLDLAVANGLSVNVSVLLGNGDGTFQAAANYVAGNGPGSVTVGDFNGDGKLDFAIVFANDVPANGWVTVVLNAGGTTIATTSSASPSNSGQPVTFTTSVARTLGTSTPTGTVTFQEQGTALGSPVTLNASGVAMFTTSALSIGTHSIVALYSGDSAFYPNTATGITQTVVAAPVAQLSPTSLSFGNQVVGAPSATQPVTLTNTGTAPLTITSISASADYAQTNNCGSSIAAQANCTITVTFTPSTVGSRPGTVSIVDNAADSPQTISLSGTGVSAPVVNLSPGSIAFNGQFVGTPSPQQTVTLTNSGTAPLAISSVAVAGDFAQSNNCGTSVAVGASCTFTLTFTPTAPGNRPGTVTITDNAGSGSQIINLSGFGYGQGASIIVNTTAQFAGSPSDCTVSDAIIAGNTNAQVNGCAAGVPNANNTITVPAGTYHLTQAVNNDRGCAGASGTECLGSILTIQGAGQASTIIQRDVGSPSFYIFWFQGGNNNTAPITINDLTIQGGDGGIRAFGANGPLAVNRCTFHANTNGALGDDGALTVDNSTFTNNSSGGSAGAAIGFDNRGGGTLTVTNSTFSGNSVPNVGSNSGGAISGGSMTIINSSFTNNTAGFGGAISNTSGNSTIKQCSFVGNSGNTGGAIVNGTGCGGGRGAITIIQSTFTNNTATNVSSCGGGGAIETTNPLVITGSTFFGNTSGGVGGAITQQNGPASLSNTTITGNTAADSGGGVFFQPGTASPIDLNNVTITNNTDTGVAGSQGGGGVAFNNANQKGASVTMENTIIALNTDHSTSNAPDCSTVGLSAGVLTSQGHNLIGNNTGCTFTAGTGDQIGTNATPIDPIIGPLQNNGGLPFVCGPSGLMCPPNFTETLLPPSPAIDAGDPGTPGSGGTTCAASDERGVPRPVGAVCDIGAFEADVKAAPAQVTFADQPLGTAGAAQTVTLTNEASTALTVNGITLSGGNGAFTQTNTCGNSVAPGLNCTVSITFTPNSVGQTSASLAFTLAEISPIGPGGFNQIFGIPLTGTAVGAPAVTLSPTSLTFASQGVGTTSQAQTITLSNSGNGSVIITSITPSGDFALANNNCPATLAPTANCTFGVTFTPTVAGPRTGTVTITDNAKNSPQTVPLTGTATGAQITVSATSLQLPDTHINQICHPRTVTITSSGIMPLAISGITLSGPFTQTNNCPATLANGATCVVTVTFAPTSIGAQTGTLTIASNTSGSLTTVALAGNGEFQCLLNPKASSTTVMRGTDSASFSLTHQTANAEAENPLQLYCTNQVPAICIFNPGTVGPMGVSTLTLSNLKALTSPSLSFDVHGDAALDKHTTGLTVLVSDFALSWAPDSATITAGQTTSFALVAAPQNGLQGTLTFNCSGAPQGATCSVSPRTASLTGSTPASVTVTVSTTARSLAGPQSAWRVLPPGGSLIGLLVLAVIGLLADVAAWTLASPTSGENSSVFSSMRLLGLSRSLASIRLRLASVGAGLTIAMVLAWGACGRGGSLSGPPALNPNATAAGTYALTVTGTYTGAAGTNAQLSHSTGLKLTVK